MASAGQMAPACTPIPLSGNDDVSINVIGGVLQAASIAAATYSTVTALDIATKEWLLAKNYKNIAQYWLDHYRNYYAGAEDTENREAHALTVDPAYYEAARGRARTISWLQYRGRVHNAVRCTSRYCTGLRQDILTDLAAAQADAVAMTDGMGYRNERAYLETRDDVRFQKVHNVVKRGRDMVADNVSLASAASNIYGNLYNQNWEGLVAAGSYLGYSQNRRATSYPSFRGNDAGMYRVGEPGVRTAEGIQREDVPLNSYDGIMRQRSLDDYISETPERDR